MSGRKFGSELCTKADPMPQPKGYEPFTDVWFVEYSVAQNTVKMCGIFPFVFGSVVHRTAFFQSPGEAQGLRDWVNSQRHGPTYDQNADGSPKLGTYTNYNLVYSSQLRYFNRKAILLDYLNEFGLKN
jgi:hypothetical protein